MHALITHTNKGGAGRLRKLEQRLLSVGATVDRTGEDFIRYHGKVMVVDRATRMLLGFNYTLLDITRSRSVGVVTKNAKTVQSAVRWTPTPMRSYIKSTRDIARTSSAIVRDGPDAFIGSQSLRTLELDKRREVGVLIKSPIVVKEMLATFEADWG